MNAKKNYETITYRTINKMRFLILDLNYRCTHFHSELEFTQVISGSLHLQTPDEDFILTEGEIALFSPYQPHSAYSSSPAACTIMTIHVDPKVCIDYMPNITNLVFETSNISNVLSEQKNKEIQSICFHIGYNYYGQKTGFEFRCMSDFNRLMGEFFVYVPHHFISDEKLQNSVMIERRMSRILQYIQENYAQKITLKEIAEREHITTSYLSHFFKDNFHESFQSYINSLRFEHALMLVLKTDRKIIDICIESGFSDSKYMNKVFLEKYHMTPKEFRQRYRDGQLNAKPGNPSSQETDSQYFYNISESLAALRRSHYFRCDDGSHPNSII